MSEGDTLTAYMANAAITPRNDKPMTPIVPGGWYLLRTGTRPGLTPVCTLAWMHLTNGSERDANGWDLRARNEREKGGITAYSCHQVNVSSTMKSYWREVTMSLFEDDPGLIRRQEGQVREQAERAHAMRRRIESIHGVGVSPSRGVTVTVDSAGTLLALAIDDAPTELCDAIVAAYAAARRDVGEQVITASQDAFGESFPGIERLRSLYGVPSPDVPLAEASDPRVHQRRL